jgi:Short C-terminal domain
MSVLAPITAPVSTIGGSTYRPAPEDHSLPQLTEQGLQTISDLAQRYGVSADAVMTLLQALLNSKGMMAQFDHRELGGAGQWMRGGMTMVGDMFNHGLKAKVDGLCSELSQLLATQPFVPFAAGFQSQSQRQGGGQQEGGHDVSETASVSLFVPEASGQASGHWWPAELGVPNGTGAQNQVRYAYFNQTHRLAVELNGHVTVYDTLDHQIGGVSQQQGGGGSLTLTSQHGTVSVSTLPVVAVDGAQTKAAEPRAAPASEPGRADNTQERNHERNHERNMTQERNMETDIFGKIERLAELHQKGILSADEFTAKKAELLARL